jgi:hypothetical protein
MKNAKITINKQEILDESVKGLNQVSLGHLGANRRNKRAQNFKHVIKVREIPLIDQVLQGNRL